MIKTIGIAAACCAWASAGIVAFGAFDRSDSKFEVAENGSLRGSIGFDANSSSSFVPIKPATDNQHTASITLTKKITEIQKPGFTELGGIDEALHTGPVSGFNYIIDEYASATINTSGGIDESLHLDIDTTLTGSIQQQAPRSFKRTFWERFDRHGNPID